MNGVLVQIQHLKGYTVPGTTWANQMNFVINHAPGAGSTAHPVDQQSSALPLYHGCPHAFRRYWHPKLVYSMLKKELLNLNETTPGSLLLLRNRGNREHHIVQRRSKAKRGTTKKAMKYVFKE